MINYQEPKCQVLTPNGLMDMRRTRRDRECGQCHQIIKAGEVCATPSFIANDQTRYCLECSKEQK